MYLSVTLLLSVHRPSSLSGKETTKKMVNSEDFLKQTLRNKYKDYKSSEEAGEEKTSEKNLTDFG